MKYLVLLLILTGCADVQGPIERSKSVAEDWREFGRAAWEDMNG